MFLYRFMFVLADESGRMVRARETRSFSRRPMPLKTFTSIIGHLLLRTLDRAERVYRAMCCRGFDGSIRVIKPMNIDFKDMAFMIIWTAIFISFRLWDVPVKLGELLMRIF
jgi:cobalt/nickel transport system permease protein